MTIKLRKKGKDKKIETKKKYGKYTTKHIRQMIVPINNITDKMKDQSPNKN